MISRELCLRILRATSESAVTEIIDADLDLSNDDSWTPVDNRDTNFNVITNQASTGGKALTELCTNMVDAVLMKHAHEHGIDPTGADAPKSVLDGVRELVQLRGARSGRLSEVDDERYLRGFAEGNLVIGVHGGTRRDDPPCFTFVDNGEGQRPEDFESTFLSLSKGNKSGIPFVQGKYSMGSSGVLSYCGRRWYKLIISRRFNITDGPWGWTLLRRRPHDGPPIAEYFSPTGSIPSFTMPLLHPMNLKSGAVDEKVKIQAGTVVKLYDYHIGSPPSFRGVREALHENLVSTILPFRIMDYRYPADTKRDERRAQGVDERPLYGMEYPLLRRHGQEIDEADDEGTDDPLGSEHHIGEVNHPYLGLVSARVIVLQKNLPGWLKYPRNTSRVFHAVNGQVQFKQNRGYLSQQCKLPGLKDRLVVIIDASDLSEAAHNDVWKGDREQIRATPVGDLYKDEVTKLVRDSEYLKALQQRIFREETENLTEKGQELLFQNLVDSDPNIAQLLPSGSVVTLPGYIGHYGREIDDWEGKYSPTFLKLLAKRIQRDGIYIGIDGRRTVAFSTDTANDYLVRQDNRGRIFVVGKGKDKFSYRSALRNGRLTLTFEALPGKVTAGEEFMFSVGLLDDAIAEPVTEEVKILAVTSRQPKPPGPRPSPHDPEPTLERSLPPSKWLTRDGRLIGEEATDPWPEGFTDQDGGRVEDLGEAQKLYSINYDNAHFRHFFERERAPVNKKVIAEQYRMAMLVLMLGFEDAYSRMEQTETKVEIEEQIDEVRRLVAQGAATVVMSIAKTLPTIVNPASVADPDD